jgi:hypothetical protein
VGGRSCAADGDHQGSAVAVRLAVRSWESAGQPRHRGSCLADHRSGAVSVVAAWTGRVHRPNHPMYTSTLSNWEDFGQSEMLRARDA